MAGGKASIFSRGPEDPTLESGFIHTGCPKRREVRACLSMPLCSPDVRGSRGRSRHLPFARVHHLRHHLCPGGRSVSAGQRGAGGRGFLVSWATPDSSESCEWVSLPGVGSRGHAPPRDGAECPVPRPSPTGGRRSSLCAVGSSMGWWSWRQSVPCAMTQRWTTTR